jgi:hypothetical protein
MAYRGGGRRGAAARSTQDQVEFVEAGDGLADGAGAEAGVFHDLADGVWEGLLCPSAALRLTTGVP